MLNRILFVVLVIICSACGPKAGWPPINNETKPWTRWWWHGSALTKEGITAELEAYAKAGLGGVEITPIYGVKGYEDKFVPYLSEQWMELLDHTLSEAKRLDLGVDMATGTGWPFGGPWITDDFSSRNIFHKVYELSAGQSLKEPVEFTQPPLLQTVGTESAVEQIRLEKKLPLVSLMAYSNSGEVADLYDKVYSGKLNWSPSSGTWKIYALFQGWHGKMVERAAPGGEGPVIDHFSGAALDHYLARFDSAFEGHDISYLRAFFNDSYEVDDARGAADWTSALLHEFKERRGYDLKDHLPALFDSTSVNSNAVLYDYRLTISEMLLDNFTKAWQKWSLMNHGALVRNQAHGSPANILDLYSAVDIPEIEGTEPLRIRMATSAANVAHKKYVSSESATWLDEHFESSLGDVKDAVDVFLLNGVNHIFYHNTSYSPPGEPWPGWLFYAATHLNPRNPQWVDFDVLNNYVARCQSLLQHRYADNEILLYYPIADPMSKFGLPAGRQDPEMVEHFDGIGKQFKGSAFEAVATQLLQKGYTFDFISDKQIQALSLSETKLIIVPSCKYIPEETMHWLNRLPNVVMFGSKPGSYAGLKNSDKPIDVSPTIEVITSFDNIGVQRETMVDMGLQFYRKNGVYFIRNNGDQPFDDFVPVNRTGRKILFDPMTGVIGMPEQKDEKVRLQLHKGQTIMIVESKGSAPAFPYITTIKAVPLDTKWTITFESGGPTLPPSIETYTLGSWTDYDSAYKRFSGVAIYRTTFKLTSGHENGWILDLGDVRESAQIILNGKEIGRLISPPFRVKIEPSMAQPDNVLEIRIANLMANRIAELDRRGILWKKFYNVNFPARKAENRKDGLFDASGWVSRPSGILGPVQLLFLPGSVER